MRCRRGVDVVERGGRGGAAGTEVRCGGGGGIVRGERGAQWRWQVMVDGGRYVRGRESEFIGTYQNLSEEIGWVRISSDGLR